MRILMVHNYYQRWGGSDQSAEEDIRLLTSYGEDVRLYKRDNKEIEGYSLVRKSVQFFNTTWSADSTRAIKEVIEDFRPDIAHFHNHFPLISPSAYYACHAQGVPVIQTLHDYRLFCPLGWFFRDGVPCEACLEKSLLQSIRHSCYHNSRIQTASIALMLAAHRRKGTWLNKVDVYIALTDFVRDKLISEGFPAEKIEVRPNYLSSDPGYVPTKREYALFVGRLSYEKGVLQLVEAWRRGIDVPLKIVGTGPLAAELDEIINRENLLNVELVGFQPIERIIELMRGAYFAILPSLSYELMPRTLVEAYAVGTPVIASDIGSLSTLVESERTGLLFTSGDPDDIVDKVKYALNNPGKLRKWGCAARDIFESRFTPEQAYRKLIDVYDQAIQRAK